MKDIDNDLLLYTRNLVNSIYSMIYSTTPKEYDFYLWDITRRLKHISSYKKRLLRNYIKFRKDL